MRAELVSWRSHTRTAAGPEDRVIKGVISRSRHGPGGNNGEALVMSREAASGPAGGGPPHQAARSRRSQSLRALTAAFVTNGSHRRRGVELRALPATTRSASRPGEES